MTGRLLNIKQVQELLGLSERTVFRLIKNNDLKGFKAGREWRFEESDIDAYIAEQRKKAQLEANKL
jgi:excisionase family DNA binding protein